MKKYIRNLEKDQDSQVRGTGIPKLKSTEPTEAQNKKLKNFKSKGSAFQYFWARAGLHKNLRIQTVPRHSLLRFIMHQSDKSDSLLPSSPNTSQNNTSTDTPPCTPGTSQPSFQTQFF